VFAPEVPLTLSIEVPQNPVCEGAGSLIATAGSGAAPYQYAWSHGDTVANPIELSAGTYDLTLTDAKGCEAVASATLDPLPTFRSVNPVTICQGESYEYEGLILTRDTLICDTVRVDNACDSLFCFELQVRPVFERSMEASICHGETFEFYGSLLSVDTSLCISRPAPNGCDSTICLNLKVLRPQSEQLVQFCTGDSYSWRGLQFSEPGLYTDTIENMFGCDSLLFLRLDYFQLPELKIEQVGSFCAGDALVQLRVADHFDGYLWSNGRTSAGIRISQPGRYFLTAFDDENRCYASDTINITEAGIERVSWSSEDPSCYGYSDGSFTIDSLSGGQLPVVLSINEEPFHQSWSAEGLKAGLYTATVEDAVGCRKEVRFRLNDPPEPYIDLPMDISIGLGDSVLLEPATNLQAENILWTPSDYLSCDDCLTPVAFPVQSTRYQLTISDTTGCRAQADIQINVNRRASLFVPNTFSPNGDGINDELVPFGGNSVARIKLFRVFDRWGNLLFERKDFQPGQAGWDGRARGEEVPKGVYIYHLEVERIDGEIEVFTGDVMLLK
jgi:gliding motility-associated-like protein